MSCGVSENVDENRRKRGTGRIRKAFSDNFSFGTSSKAARVPTTSAPTLTADASSSTLTEKSAYSAASSLSVIAQAGSPEEELALTELNPPAKEAPSETESISIVQKCKNSCLCWGYCCGYLCPDLVKGKATKDVEDDPTNELLVCEGEPIPTLEEIRSWGKSFDTLMTSVVGRQVFAEFLKVEFSHENIMFWLACEDLKLETNPEIIAEKVRLIYEDYVSIISPKEVSLDSHVREIVNRNMVEPTAHTFDDAQMQIYMLMMRDSYPRFVNAPLYKSLAQEPEQDALQPSGSAESANGKPGEPQVQG